MGKDREHDGELRLKFRSNLEHIMLIQYSKSTLNTTLRLGTRA